MGTICADQGAACALETETIQRPTSVLAQANRLLRSVFAWVLATEAKRLSRLELAELTVEQLADIGVTPAEAHREASQPFWK
ncbi:DUF1127 domain-containing protein [Pararhizobium sp. BT-229]|uniref:DUF1127 domain-containing protein n=1 Tax=Pararhizobium sp. BT-229 TaxID=2986923 RepID=UPI0021F76B9C|nr:DUF1127 domain-containing protein [Pararhizobium sp. BT-229]MCV9960541.1 DUF1127 domain-containing protein [Pararhizobium sp. BT-229]